MDKRRQHTTTSSGMLMLMIAVLTSLTFTPAQALQQATAVAAKPAKGVVIRGCLAGSKLTHIDTEVPMPTVPDTLRVSSIRVIRSQVKALDGHRVELIGTLRGIPGQENGLLVVDSDKGRLYIGGGDPRLGEDFNVARLDPPTIYAHTIKDIGPACATGETQ